MSRIKECHINQRGPLTEAKVSKEFKKRLEEKETSGVGFDRAPKLVTSDPRTSRNCLQSAPAPAPGRAREVRGAGQAVRPGGWQKKSADRLPVPPRARPPTTTHPRHTTYLYKGRRASIRAFEVQTSPRRPLLCTLSTMSGASDKARFYLEQAIPQLQEFEQKEIFTKVRGSHPFSCPKDRQAPYRKSY